MKKVDYNSANVPTTSAVDLLMRTVEFEHERDGLIEAIARLATGITGVAAPDNTLVALYGCVVTDLGGGNYSCTAGAILFNDEIYLVDAVASVAVTGSAYKFGTKETYGSQGTLSTGALVNDLQIRKIVFYGTTTPSGVTNIFTAPGFIGRLRSNFSLDTDIQTIFTAIADSGWQTPTLINSATNVNFKYRKVGKIVYLRGLVNASTMSSSWDTGAFFTFPSGYRPAQEAYVSFWTYDAFPPAATGVQGTLRIKTDGDILVPAFGGSGLKNIGSMDNICFFID